MSDSEHSDSSSEGEDLETTGLIATRQKRATAGNLYATLRANLDDEELQKELLAEDEEEDAGEYEGSDKEAGDDDDALESSSDEEDAGPPKEGDLADLEGEKALKKQERVEARKKRKAHDARLRLPAWKNKKRVKLADDVKTEDGSTSERPKKKSERSNWLPSAADAPIRQSGRALAVNYRETVHANLKQSAARSEKQRRVMKDAAEREKTKKRMTEMTQEERLKKCERIERETAKELGRWEREEAERQRLREEALAAKRKRGIDGPFIKHWSGSVMWEGDRIKIRRLSHGSRKVEEIKEEPKDGEDVKKDGVNGHANKEPPEKTVETASRPEQAAPSKAAFSTNSNTQVPTTAKPNASAAPIPPCPEAVPASGQEAPVSWLQGIQEYAAQPETTLSQPLSQPSMTNGYTPSAPSINGPPAPAPSHAHPQPQTNQQLMTPLPPPEMYHGWPPGSHQFSIQAQPPPPPPSIPLIRQQAQRSLIILENFKNLDIQSAKRTSKTPSKPDTTLLEPDPLKNTLLPTSYPPLTPTEKTYLLSRPRRKGQEQPLPPPPPKQRCAVTSWVAKFRDPKTALAYADLHQYKVIQRVLAGGCQWSSLLGCWVGPMYGAMGRPSRGVPAGFAGDVVKKEE